jgi:hypothetical protein
MGAPVRLKKYVGNNLTLTLVGHESKAYLVVGNNCSVKLADNVSSIKIVGDNCTLQVASGGGAVIYVGNNGSVHLDQSIDEDVVTYVGNNGVVSSKDGAIPRHCSDGDVRRCGSSGKVVNLDGECNVTVAGVRTCRKLTKLATGSLPNIRIHLGGLSRRTR